MRALRVDGWAKEKSGSATMPFYQEGARIVMDYHSGKTFGPEFLKGILDSIGWSEADLKRLKLIKYESNDDGRIVDPVAPLRTTGFFMR